MAPPATPPIDLNLLAALDALLTEASVTAAARRLGLSASAMSRTLARLRAATNDPLLVRAGRGLVPTPHATALRDRVQAAAREAHAVLSPQAATPDLDQLFTLRANEGFIEAFSVPLLHRLAQQAPSARLRFAPKPDKDSRPLREGEIDLEIGVVEGAAPEIRTRPLFRDEFIGVARLGHPILAGQGITPEAYAAATHVAATPRARETAPVDAALATRGLARTIRITVPGFPDAMRIARHTDLLAVIPRSCLGSPHGENHAARLGLQGFPLPVPTPGFMVSAIWHPRLDADPAQAWLRDLVTALCRETYPGL